MGWSYLERDQGRFSSLEWDSGTVSPQRFVTDQWRGNARLASARAVVGGAGGYPHGDVRVIQVRTFIVRKYV